MNRIVLDYETQNELNLKDVGVFKYVTHPSSDVLCFSFKINNEPVKSWNRYTKDFKTIDKFLDLLERPNTQIVAHNAMFEYAVTKHVLTKYYNFTPPPIEQFNDTAAKAAACALPRDLESAAIVMKLPVLKNMDGRKLVTKYMKPTPQWYNWYALKEGKEPKKYYNDFLELEYIYEYCDIDVTVTDLLDKKLPDLTPYEHDTWVRNMKMNERGISVDVKTARHIVNLNREDVKEQNDLAYRLTEGAIETVNQVQELLHWLRSKSYPLLDLTAPVVKSVLENKDIDKDVRQVLEARQIVSMTSNKKYISLIKRADKDSRIRDNTMYHGASTGREAGRGVQVQNLPRGSVKNTDLAIDVINICDELEDVKMFYETPSKLFSSCIRGMFIASEGCELFASDANAIECRVLNWIAGQDDVVEAFRENKDPYKMLASKIFNTPINKITDDQRFVGKQGELASGYGVGDVKFASMCAQFGREISKELSQKTIKIYRKSHPEVVKLWYTYENAAIKAVKQKASVNVGKVTWFYKNEFLWCRLPSGRNLSFPYPSIRNEPTPWGETKPKLYYYRIDPMTKQWVNRATYGGSLVESVCQATARDVIFHGIKNVEDFGFKYLFSVHDEIVSEYKKGEKTIKEYSNLLATPAKWYEDLPLKYGGWTGPRYKKG